MKVTFVEIAGSIFLIFYILEHTILVDLEVNSQVGVSAPPSLVAWATRVKHFHSKSTHTFLLTPTLCARYPSPSLAYRGRSLEPSLVFTCIFSQEFTNL